MYEDISSLISPELEENLNSCINLPSLPAVALRVIEASKDPDISLHEVSEIISSDPAISAKILKIANSPLYSQRRSLSNLREALSLLGFNASLTIALSFSLLRAFSNENADHESYWKRSILSASIARLLGVRLRVIKLEDLFLASLLQDIGILVIQCLKESPYPHDNNQKLKHVERAKLEKNLLNVEHPAIGAWLLSSWKLPDYLVKSVLFSHSLNMNGDQRSADNTFHFCLNLSGTLADVWLDDNPGELLLSVLNVTKNIFDYNEDEFNQLILDIDNALPEISDMFQITLIGNEEREKVINEARELLLERSIHSIKQSEDDRRYIESITNRVEQIEKTSRIDHLTKIFNRQHIDELLETEFKEATANKWPLSLAFIDIDDFKLINDSCGHLVGDEILKLISDFFVKNIRETDIIARYGGDEFLLMLPGSTGDIAKIALERLLALYIDEVHLESKGITISASLSIGLATHQDKNNFDSLKDFMGSADEALYKAKAEGKSCLAVY